MKATITYCGLLFLTLLSGCKIEINSPTTGSVVSESLSYSCDPGDTCIIDVSDTFFDETFRAKPADSFQFTSWKKKTLCGNRKKPCNLSTVSFGDNEDLLAILDSDITVYLQPEFAIQRKNGVIRGVHMTGNIGPVPDAIESQPQSWFEFAQGLYANWVAISVTLYVDDSLDSSVEPDYDHPSVPTFTDEQLKRVIRAHIDAGYNVFLQFGLGTDPGVPGSYYIRSHRTGL